VVRELRIDRLGISQSGGSMLRQPLTSWAVLVSEGAAQMRSAPWLLIFPAILLAITLFCFNFIGDGLRDALDPETDSAATHASVDPVPLMD
jgi:ABC-type dipeptide/oligopeptide/nickel transport system permease subunit